MSDQGLIGLIKERLISGGLKSIINSSALLNVYLSNSISGKLRIDEIRDIIEEWGYIASLMQHHVDAYCTDEEILQLACLASSGKYSIDKFIRHLSTAHLLQFLDNILSEKSKGWGSFIKPVCLELCAHRDINITILKYVLDQLTNYTKSLTEDEAAEFDEYNFVEELAKVWERNGVSEERVRSLLWLVEHQLGITYEVHQRMDDFGPFIIAYKGVTKDGHSVFSDRVTYKVGEEYTAICDSSSESENSYGLSAWDYKKAKEWCSEKVLELKIYLKDIRYISINEGKIRATKFFVIREVNDKSSTTKHS